MTFQSVLEPSVKVSHRPDRIVVINDHSSTNGGTAALCLLSIRHFRARGIPVTFVCGDAGENAALRALGVDIRPLGSADLLMRAKLKAAIEGVHNTAAKTLLDEVIAEVAGPDTIFHVHGWAQILSPSIFSALKKVAHRTFIHAHDTFLACPNGMYMDYQKNEVCTRRPLSAGCIATNCDKRSYMQKLWRVARHNALVRSLDKNANWAGIITIHPDVVTKFTRAGFPADRLITVRNPAQAFSNTRVLAEQNDTIVYVGRLERDKGVLDLAKASRTANVKLRMIGDGALFEMLAQNYPEIELTGWQSPKQIGGLVQDARALVMPSHHPEPVAMVIPEAVQSGLPVLVSDTAVLAREIERRGFGLSFNVFDAEHLTSRLEKIKKMPEQDMRSMSETCVNHGHDLSLTQEAWSDALLQKYCNAIEDVPAASLGVSV